MSAAEERRRFDVGQCVGSGGFGEVYRASMVSGGGVRSEVALKVLHAGLDPRSQAIQRLADEAKLLGLLSHPSILRIHDLVLLEGRITLVTEYVAGADLDVCTTTPRDPMPDRAILQAISHVAAALHTAFNTEGPDGVPLHLLHRDIKPSNIRIGRHGQVKLLDFGIAKAAGERTAKTQTNALIGSFSYMAPERLDRDEHDGAPGDTFALGVTLAEALIGKQLFDASIKEIYRISMDETRLRDHVRAYLDAATLPPGVRTLIEEMTSYVPGDRPALATLAERLEDLADAADGQTLSRWCRNHEWEDGAIVDGELSGRSITESRLSAEILGRRLVAEQPTGSLADRTFQYAIDDALPAVPSFTDPENAVAALPDDDDGYLAPRRNGLVLGGAILLLVALPILGVVGGGVAVLGMVSAGRPVDETLPDPIEQPDPTDPPVDAPVVAPRPSPTPAPDDGVADVAPQPDSVDPNSLDRCGPWPALEAQSLAGRLGPAAVCLEEVLSDIAMTQVNRDKLGRILIVDARTRCIDGAGCGDYERVQRTFFEVVTRSDAEMLYAFSTHMAGIADTDASRREALLWARRAMELKAAWQGPTRIQRVDALNERIARLTYATFSADSSNERARVEARNAAVDWMNYRITIGGDHAPALALCASVEGSEVNCKTRGHDVGAQFAVTFLSRPLGATVTVDGQQYGTAPQVVELPAGPHEVRMQTEESSTVQRIDTGLDKPTRWLWSVSDDAWTGTK